LVIGKTKRRLSRNGKQIENFPPIYKGWKKAVSRSLKWEEKEE